MFGLSTNRGFIVFFELLVVLLYWIIIHAILYVFSAADEQEVRWENYGVVPGLSESDFMSRQRYLENSG